MKKSQSSRTRRQSKQPRLHLNLSEVEFVLSLDERIRQALARIAQLEVEVAELQAKVLVRP